MTASVCAAGKASALPRMLGDVIVKATPAPHLDIYLGNSGIYFSCQVLTHCGSLCGQCGNMLRFVSLGNWPIPPKKGLAGTILFTHWPDPAEDSTRPSWLVGWDTGGGGV